MMSLLDDVRVRFEADWKKGLCPSIEECIERVPQADRTAAVCELIRLEVRLRGSDGDVPPSFDSYAERFPESKKEIRRLLLNELPPVGSSEAAPASRGQQLPTQQETQDPYATHPGAEPDVSDPYATHLPLGSEHEPDPFATLCGPGSGGSADDINAPPFQRIRLIHSPEDSPGSFSASRFRVLKSHARGGLGEVFLARDEELNRDVALKEIQARHLEHTESTTRFLLEAEVTGRLEHPGIVPVYSLGRYDDGRPFYAMKFVRGSSLQDAIRQFHDQYPDKTSRLFFGREMHQMLRRFIDVCNAIGYAHDRGVLHRDIKPANIMLGNFGETLVVDWGLAKIMEAVETPISEEAARIESTNTMATAAGSVVGTPAFMSPEQAGNSEHDVSDASDIYSLGATLFAILTNGYSIQGENTYEILENIQKGNIYTIRQIVPSAPAALEAICSKAMSLRPFDRYQTARAMADDIERWLADESVEAYRGHEPRLEQAGRLLRRYRSWTVSIAGALLAIVLISSLATFLVNRARIKEKAAQVQATTFKGEALDRYRMSRSAIDRWLVGSSESLAGLPATQSIRKQLLEQAAEDLGKLSATRSADPELEIERARALVRLGDIYQMQENYALARVQYSDAANVLASEIVTTSPAADQRRLAELANTHCRSGLAWDFEEQTSKAEEKYLKAIETLRTLVGDQEELASANRYLAATLANLADLYRRTGRLTQAIPVLEESITNYYAAGQVANDRKQRIAAVTTREILARTQEQLGQHETALATLDACIDDLESLHSDRVDTPAVLIALASVHVSRSGVARSLGLWDVEVVALQQAADFYGELRASQPDVPRYVESQAITETDLGLAFLHRSESQTADRHFKSAQRTYRQLVESYPKVPRFQEGLAAALDGYAQSQMDLNRDLSSAIESLAIAGQVYTQLIEQSPEQVQYFHRLGIVTSHFAQCLALNGERESARQRFEESEQLLEQLIATNPNAPGFQSSLAHVIFRHAILDFQDAPDNAKPKFVRAIELWRSIVAEAPENSDYQYELAKILLRCPDTSVRDPEYALGLMQNIAQQSPGNPLFLSLLAQASLADDAQESIALLDRVELIRGSLIGDDLCIRALAQQELGEHAAANTSLMLAGEWLNAHRPQSTDLQRLLQETKLRLDSEGE
ncbi:protein kinase domain-containing protein [Rosistilla oblonga]|uniref:protein kinase domain-containing protein n=1 Tax=Rosistilla oblonga TaxID=2527990 RepID=UPI003A975455